MSEPTLVQQGERYQVELFDHRGGNLLVVFLESIAKQRPGWRLISVVPYPLDDQMLYCIFEVTSRWEIWKHTEQSLVE